MNEFATNLQTLLASRGKSAKDLADYCGVSRQTAHRWINGTILPNDKHLQEIASFLVVPIDHLSNEGQARIRTQAISELGVISQRLTDKQLCILLKIAQEFDQINPDTL